MTLSKKLWKEVKNNAVEHAKKVLNGEADSIMPHEFHEKLVKLHAWGLPVNNCKDN